MLENRSNTQLLYDESVDPLTDLIGERRRFPVLIIPSQSPRTDQGTSIMQEAQRFAGLRQTGDITTGLTIPAAPHTLSTIPVAAVENYVSERFGMTPEIPVTSDTVAAHGVVWMWGKNGERMDIPRIAALPKDQQTPYVQAITDQVGNGVHMFQELLGLSQEETSRTLRMYGLWGHGINTEIAETGRSRGSPSQRDFHMNLVHLRSDELTAQAKLERVTLSDLVKHIGPWDTVVYHLFNGKIQGRLRNIVNAQLPGERVKVTAEQMHGRNNDGSAVHFHDGFKLRFVDGVPFSDAFSVLLAVVNDAEVTYDGLIERHEQFYKNIGNPNAQAEVQQEALTFAAQRGFDGKAAATLINLVRKMHPTYIQLSNWIDELPATDPSRRKLEQMHHSYELIHRAFTKKGGAGRISKIMQGNYGMSRLEADIFSFMIADTVRPQDEAKKIESTMPVHMSGTYLFEDYALRDGNIRVNGLSIATRLGGTKGVLEDLVGVVVKRQKTAQDAVV